MNRKVLLAVLGLLAAVGIAALRTSNDLDGASTAGSSTGTELDAGQQSTGALDPMSGLPMVDLDQLPVEAADTIALIRSGGPFPFDRDDTVFQNREELLPDRPTGHYREYTVITPGEDDRGAQRIVAGGDGELYYTADHYSSFVVVAGGEDRSP